MALSSRTSYVWFLETARTLLLAVALPLFMAIQLIVGKGTIRLGVMDRVNYSFVSTQPSTFYTKNSHNIIIKDTEQKG
jgi:hypothetical protein